MNCTTSQTYYPNYYYTLGSGIFNEVATCHGPSALTNFHKLS